MGKVETCFVMYLEISDLKKHLNIDHDEDDAYIKELIEVAEDSIATYLNRPLSDFVEKHEDGRCNHDTLKPAIRHAIRLAVGAWYANRESVTYGSASELPNGIAYLLLPLKKF